MVVFGLIALFSWPLVVLWIFATRRPVRAVVFSFVFALLSLPNIGIDLPGIPIYSKMSATVMSVLLSTAIFDIRRLFEFRPRWFDLPMIAWCLVPIASSVSNGLGLYDGLATVLLQLFIWGFAYLIGRIYLSSLDGMRELTAAIAVGGLLYVPLCLVELRISPVLELMIYGSGRPPDTRYGGYRPHVFLTTGLELGMYMTSATLFAIRLWAARTIRSLWGIPFGALTLVLAIVTVLCKATGALLLLLLGLGILWAVRRSGRSWPIWVLLSVAPLYSASRATGLWSGSQVVAFAKVFGEDRAQSVEFRLYNEDLFIGKTLQRPAFGWGGHDRLFLRDKYGKSLSVIDGYWIVAYGTYGLVGLVAFNLMQMTPIVVMLRRHPVATWGGPAVVPAAAAAVFVGLFLIDNLSNAMPTPLIGLILGGLCGLPAAEGGGPEGEARRGLDEAEEIAAGGRWIEAGPAFRRAVELASAGPDGPARRRIRAEALGGLGLALAEAGRSAEAEASCRDAVDGLEALTAVDPDVDHFRALATARERLARVVAGMGRTAEAIEEREAALAIREAIRAADPDHPDDRDCRVNSLNDLAWLLVSDDDPGPRDPAHAVRLAERAVREAPGRGDCWNTLGVARFRAGDWAGAVEALERSAASGPDGGTAFDFFFLAMSWRRLGDKVTARDWFDRAVAWSTRNRPGHPGLARFRDEAAALLGGSGRHGRDGP